MTDFNSLYDDLENHITKLRDDFISRFSKVDPNINPDNYRFQVQAFCVLSHSAFEQFFEEVAKKVMEIALDDLLNSRKVNEVLLSLIAYSGKTLDIKNEDEKQKLKNFDYMRELTAEAKKKFSNTVHNNNGASVKHLRKLMIPVSIDITQDDNYLNSLNQLSNQRGEYSHKGNF